MRRYVDVRVSADIGFEAFVIQGPRGPIKVVPDQFCPRDTAFGVKLDMLRLYSLKAPVRVIENDGLMALRQPSADGVEIRAGFKGNLGCWAPVSTVNVSLAAP